MLDVVVFHAAEQIIDLLRTFDCLANPGGVLQLLIELDRSGSLEQQAAVLQLLLNECAPAFAGQWLLFVDAWDEQGWLVRLRTLRDQDIAIEPPGLAILIAQAPTLHTSEIVQLTMRWAGGPDHQLLSEAGQRLVSRVEDRPADEQFPEEKLDACWWPNVPTEAHLEMLGVSSTSPTRRGE